jgi:hypothetical protein
VLLALVAGLLADSVLFVVVAGAASDLVGESDFGAPSVFAPSPDLAAGASPGPVVDDGVSLFRLSVT